ncbi:MAG: amidohydrolase family protein [Bdellovibrionaceae bacterium]|nr:amidohydrolase family protein [Pseudobdellovibrionaceae bacterium]
MKKLKDYKHSQLEKHKCLFFKNATVVSPDHNLLQAHLLIENGKIAFISQEEPSTPLPSEKLVIDASNFIISPSFINAHSHVAMNIFRDLAHQQQNMIHDLFFPWEKKLDPEIVTALSYPYIWGGLLSGTSTFADHYYFESGIVKALEQFGVKGLIGETTADLNGAFPSKENWNQTKKWIENWPYDRDKFVPVVAPHAGDSVSESLLKDIARFAKQNQLPLHMHLSQTAQELEFCLKNYNMSAVEFAEKCGVLGPNTIAVHLVSASDKDLQIIKDTGTVFGFTPVSEIIYERLPNFKKILELEIPFALGTDCAASNDTSDLISEMKVTHLLAQDRGYKNNLTQKVLASTTHRAAQAYGQNQWSTLKVGACADLVFFEKSLETLPVHIPQENLIFSQSSQNVKHVMVNGEWILFNRKSTKVDIEDLKQQFLSALKRYQVPIYASPQRK